MSVTPPSPPGPGFGRFGIPGLRRRLLGARLALLWERLWPAVWPALGIVGLFAGVALFDVLPVLPGWLHGAILAGFGVALLTALWRGFRSFVWPSAAETRRRLERGGGIAHRPLQAMSDRLAAGADSAQSSALWAVHQRRMAEAARRLRVGTPAPGLARRDPWALRLAVLLLVGAGFAVAGFDAPDRVGRALSPRIASLAEEAPPRLELWITPPAYTHKPPLFPLKLAEQGKTELTVPDGSELAARVFSPRGRKATLVLGDTRTRFEKVDENNGKVTLALSKGGRLAVELGGETLGAWSLSVVGDAPPSIAFDGPPAPTPAAALRITYKAEDDYGIETVEAVIRRTYEHGEVIGKEEERLRLPLPGLNVRSANETSYHDLTPHRWAGLPVVMHLEATDAAGHRAESKAVKLTMPERVFENPVARAIIEQRKRLTTEPDRRRAIAEGLEAIASQPQAFEHDVVVFLALVMARSRLIREPEDTAIEPVRELLWDTALRVEDGRLSIAERELRRAEDALMRALAENAPDEEIERLLREYEQALSRFMQALNEQMQRQAQQQQPMPFDPRAQLMQSTDLQRLMEQIRDLIRAGNRDAARQLLAQLRNMLEQLRTARPMMMPGQQGQMGQAMNQLQQLIQRQSELLNQTFRRSRQGFQPGQMQQGAQSQRGLQQTLQQLQQQMQQMMQQMQQMMGQQGQDGQQGPAQALDQAGQAMGQAADALGRGRAGEAVDAQGRALNSLQQAGQQLMQQMMNQFARQNGMGRGDQRFNPLRQRRDPLGRYVPGEDGIDTQDIKVPDQSDVQRAQDILDELRRRSGQRHRPELELEYIDRLLKRF